MSPTFYKSFFYSILYVEDIHNIFALSDLTQMPLRSLIYVYCSNTRSPVSWAPVYPTEAFSNFVENLWKY
jgi:hypothetical protein